MFCEHLNNAENKKNKQQLLQITSYQNEYAQCHNTKKAITLSIFNIHINVYSVYTIIKFYRYHKNVQVGGRYQPFDY